MHGRAPVRCNWRLTSRSTQLRHRPIIYQPKPPDRSKRVTGLNRSAGCCGKSLTQSGRHRCPAPSTRGTSFDAIAPETLPMKREQEMTGIQTPTARRTVGVATLNRPYAARELNRGWPEQTCADDAAPTPPQPPIAYLRPARRSRSSIGVRDLRRGPSATNAKGLRRGYLGAGHR